MSVCVCVRVRVCVYERVCACAHSVWYTSFPCAHVFEHILERRASYDDVIIETLCVSSHSEYTQSKRKHARTESVQEDADVWVLCVS
jgi:hypothetical protein